jgi:hypothetical protein
VTLVDYKLQACIKELCTACEGTTGNILLESIYPEEVHTRHPASSVFCEVVLLDYGTRVARLASSIETSYSGECLLLQIRKIFDSSLHKLHLHLPRHRFSPSFDYSIWHALHQYPLIPKFILLSGIGYDIRD